MARAIQAKRMGKARRKSVKSRSSRGSRRALTAFKPYNGIQGTNPANVGVFRGIGFPDRLFVNLVYSDSFALAPSAGTITPYNTFVVNSIWDPQDALGGGQPTYYDQFAAIYKRYRVAGAKMTCTFAYSQNSTNGIGPALVGMQSSDLATLPTTDAGTLISTPNTSYKLLVPGDSPQTVVSTYSQKNTYPGQDSLCTSAFGSNPDRRWFTKVWASPQGQEVTMPINVVMMIEYTVELTDLLQQVDA